MTTPSREIDWSCPVPKTATGQVLIAHGGGGRLTQQLIQRLILPRFGHPALAALTDAAKLDRVAGPLAFTTDSYVVRPLCFPGGDIGTLAVNGTVNDLAMVGARPLYLSAALILEEGLSFELLEQILDSMADAARQADVALVTGDTKVVDRGKGDGLYINTSGIGQIVTPLPIAPTRTEPGDAILISGDVGRHGIAVMAAREGLAFETTIQSDCAPLADLVLKLLDAGIDVRCLRDLTRGGLATALVEIAQSAGRHLHFDESRVPVAREVRAACELLGFDPLYVANEGRFVAFVAARDVERALALLRADPRSAEATLIGEVRSEQRALVTRTSILGTTRVVEMLSGEQLPRIC